jgi:hypothetical protein
LPGLTSVLVEANVAWLELRSRAVLGALEGPEQLETARLGVQAAELLSEYLRLIMDNSGMLAEVVAEAEQTRLT